MRSLLTIALFVLALLPIQAGNKVKVTLKTGTSIIGEMKSLDPMQKVVVVIGGQDTTILMKDVESLEMVKESPEMPRQNVGANSKVQLGNNKLVVTETREFPERIFITVGGNPLEFVLVPGGILKMGYDGSGSLSMKSEPIHEVEVTSFYMSTQPLPASFVTSIVGTKRVYGLGAEPAEVKDYKFVEQVLSVVVNQTDRNLRLPTEAEWEYAACSDQQHEIFSIANGYKAAYEWCSDFWAEFDYRDSGKIDPTGPSSGKQHVVRAYNADKGKFDRSNEPSGRCYKGLVRLAIKAADIHN